MSEDEVADTLRSCDAYVTSSRGEGWNLPLMEAAACGLPVIAPKAFSHHEFLSEENSFMFSHDGLKQIPESFKISEWYRDQLFVNYEAPAISKLAIMMDLVKRDAELRKYRADIFRKEILSKYTWDKVASQFTDRIIEIQGI
jgi:glycosyltransferase involved in cell wall biosynthesis